jgi:hypothetical protein
MTPVVHLELQISLDQFEKIKNGLNGILRDLGEICKKILMSKILWHCHFNIAFIPSILSA